MKNNDDTTTIATVTPAVIIHSKALADYLSSNAIRLPATYIGARRIRPSDRARDAYRHHLRERDCYMNDVDGNDYNSIQQQEVMVSNDGGGDDNDDIALAKRSASNGNSSTFDKENGNSIIDSNNKNNNTRSTITTLGNNTTTTTTTTKGIIYKIKDSNGKERRMTKKEKKQHKFLYKKMQAEEKKKRKRDAAAARSSTCSDGAGDDNVASMMMMMTEGTPKRMNTDSNSNKTETTEKPHYFKLEINQQSLDDEITELKGEKRVLPVMLSGAQAHCAIRNGILLPNDPSPSPPSSSSSSSVIIDDDLARQWATELKQSMMEAETARMAEVTIRPMAYRLIPEVWTRLRPLQQQQRQLTDNNEELMVKGVVEGDQQWSFVIPPKRQQQLSMGVDAAGRLSHYESICCVLRDTLRLHVSCGAKFGCDYLLYDGHRDERHAFAGLRIITPDDVGITTTTTTPPYNLPLPSTYDLAGYVRGLNTAGKLALLATTVVVLPNDVNDNSNDKSNQQQQRVLFVDLALEKILSAPTHQRIYKRDKFVVRKEVGLHLDKSKTG